MDTEDKKKYIFNNINLIENHNKIVNFIHYYEIKHTNNNNGYFLNISVLEDNLIDILYKLINELNNTDDDELYQKEKQIIVDNDNKIESNIKKKYKNYNEIKDINQNDFSDIDRKIISLSKNYKFE